MSPISHTMSAIQSAEHPHTDPESKPKHKMHVSEDDASEKRDSVESGSMQTYDHTHRKLKPRHVQLIGIGGTIGTALYVQIGSGLRTSGPASLFIGFSLW